MDEIVTSLFRCIQPLFRSKHLICAIISHYCCSREDIDFLQFLGHPVLGFVVSSLGSWQVETWLVVCWRVRPFRRKNRRDSDKIGRNPVNWEHYKHCIYKCKFQSGCFTLLVTAKIHGEQRMSHTNQTFVW